MKRSAFRLVSHAMWLLSVRESENRETSSKLLFTFKKFDRTHFSFLASLSSKLTMEPELNHAMLEQCAHFSASLVVRF